MIGTDARELCRGVWRFALSVVVGVLFWSGGIGVVYADDGKQEFYRQMDTLGIRLGMTVAEAQALVRSQGGDVRRTLRMNHNPSEKSILTGSMKGLFEYVATPIPIPPPITREEMAEAMKKHQIPQREQPGYTVTLYVYPRERGRRDDPDNLVIYAILTARAVAPVDIGRGRGMGGAPAGTPVQETMRGFLERMQPMYGPVRELITGSFKPEFAFLPDRSDGDSFTFEDVKAAPGDDYQRKSLTTNCTYMLYWVLQLHESNYLLSRDPQNAATISQAGLLAYVKPTRSGDIGRDAYEAWGRCGEVAHIQLRLAGKEQVDLSHVALYRYSRDQFERAVKAFAAGL